MRSFSFTSGRLRSAAVENGSYAPENEIERVVVVGLKAEPQRVHASAVELSFTYDKARGVLTIRRPGIKVVDDFEIVITS